MTWLAQPHSLAATRSGAALPLLHSVLHTQPALTIESKLSAHVNEIMLTTFPQVMHVFISAGFECLPGAAAAGAAAAAAKHVGGLPIDRQIEVTAHRLLCLGGYTLPTQAARRLQARDGNPGPAAPPVRAISRCSRSLRGVCTARRAASRPCGATVGRSMPTASPPFLRLPHRKQRLLQPRPAHAHRAAMLNWPLALLFTCTLLRAAVGEDLLVLQRCGAAPGQLGLLCGLQVAHRWAVLCWQAAASACPLPLTRRSAAARAAPPCRQWQPTACTESEQCAPDYK